MSSTNIAAIDGSGKAKHKTKTRLTSLDTISMEKNVTTQGVFLDSRCWIELFVHFHPYLSLLGEDEPILSHFFQIGLFNHQPDDFNKTSRFFRFFFREASDLAFAVLAIGERDFSSDALVRDAQVNASGSSG